jgi:4-amino-4-deoxy-L-arabinose transferase-like glycosyltransferase
VPSTATLGLIAILVLGGAARGLWIYYATRTPVALHDPTIYLSAGDQLSRGLGYRYVDLGVSAYFPPGFPFALAAVFSLVRHSPLPENLAREAAVFNTVCLLVAVGLVYAFGRRLIGTGAALVAAAIVAFLPNLVFYGGTILSEPLFIALSLGALAILLWSPWEGGRVPRGRLIAFGLLAGLAALTRPVGLLLPVALVAATWIGGAGPRRALAQGGIALAAALVVIVPWTIRNEVTMHYPILISTNAGDDLCYGHNPKATGKYVLPKPYCGTPQLRSRRAFEVREYRTNLRRGIDYATSHPWREVELLGLRMRYTFAVGDHDGVDVVESYGSDKFIHRGRRHVLVTVADVSYYVVVALALLGLPRFVRGDPRRVMVALSVVAMSGGAFIFFGADRWHVPMMPVLALPAAVGAATLWRWLRDRRRIAS